MNEQQAYCERCEKPCDTLERYIDQRHGFIFGPYEQLSETISECCGEAVFYKGNDDDAA